MFAFYLTILFLLDKNLNEIFSSKKPEYVQFNSHIRLNYLIFEFHRYLYPEICIIHIIIIIIIRYA